MPAQSSLSDQELVVQLRRGSVAAYTEMFERYQPLLYVYASKIVKDKDEASDIVQEVFLYLWDKRAEIVFEGQVLSYLYTAVRYKFFNLLDKKKVRKDYAASLQRFMLAGTPQTDDLLREREMMRIIEEQISLLPPKLKIAYELSRKANMHPAQIAELLGVSEKTVQNQVSLAIKQLKLKLSSLYLSGLVVGTEVFVEMLKKI